MNAQPQALTILLREHREVEAHLRAAHQWIGTLRDQGSAAIANLAEALNSFGSVIRKDLALHIAHEDRALFPVLARYIGHEAGPIAVMLMEHRQLEADEARFRQGLQSQDAELLAGAAQSIVQVLTAHISKEETILFPLAQRALSPADWEEVLGLVRAQG